MHAFVRFRSVPERDNHHVAWYRPDHRILLPASALAGASHLVLTDLLSRTMVAPAELPIGVITALIGAPIFLFLLLRTRWQNGVM